MADNFSIQERSTEKTELESESARKFSIMETGNDDDLKTLPTTILDESNFSKSGRKLEYSSSSSSDSSSEHSREIQTANNGRILEPKPIEASTVKENKIETMTLDETVVKYPAESSNSMSVQENNLDTSSDEDENPLDYFEFKSPSSFSQSEVSYHNQIQATDDQNGSISMSSIGKKPEEDVGESDFSPRGKTLKYSSSSSSSSSDSGSPHEKKIQLGSEETRKSSPEKKLAPDMSDDDIPISSMPNEGQFPTQYPPLQVMERHEDPGSSPYRIPSHIFARTKSNAPMEWSVASNESLFSIHMGNMSFSRDQLCWLGKSGELCKPGEFPAPPPPISEVSTPGLKPTEIRQKSADLDEEPVVTEATAAETMREVIRESAENRNQQNQLLSEAASHSASLSQRSDGSTKSFAFPILTGDGGKSISLKGGAEKQKHHFHSPAQSQPSSQPTTPKESNAAPTSKSTKNGFHLRCFSCLSCCPFCFRR